MSSSDSHISLIDLTQQLPFEIDDAIKNELCFGETLVISCGHYAGDIGEESDDSEWSCQDTTETEESVEIKDDIPFEIVDKIENIIEEEEEPDMEENFHLYFFPDCKKPLPPRDSKASLLIVDGLPQINPAKLVPMYCTCDKDKKGKCKCHTKLPCNCGAKTTADCVCNDKEEICICNDNQPQPVCICKSSDVCLCHEGKMLPKCTCDKIDKPCICHPGKFPVPVCKCPHKPKYNIKWRNRTAEAENAKEVEEEGTVLPSTIEEGPEEDYVEIETENLPCECQKPAPKPICQCRKGEECICNSDACICGVQKTCECESTDSPKVVCEGDDHESICSCPFLKQCICDEKDPFNCKCFIDPNCTCGDPDNCKCQYVCDCTDPCICDTVVKVGEEECICVSKNKTMNGLTCDCTVNQDDGRKLKKVRAGKDGYRWCHDVDPRHTFFDYGYGRHDKISYKEPEVEKVKILGLHEEKAGEEECTVDGIKAPPYRRVRKPSIDCCSSVGGISICVEMLGEDKDKFLVQVVSHASKEGAKTGSKLVSILDCNLHTMEENRTEHITKKDINKERRSYMTVCENGYYNKITKICGERNVVKRLYHSFESARNFLLEGANIVLLRYFGLRRFRGNVKTETVLMDGTICESIYVCNGVSQAVVNGKPLFVVKVQRHIIEPNGFVHQTLTVLTLRGYVVSHEWADNNYVIHLNPLLNIVPEKDHIEDHEPLRERWREDLQLLSDYLDFKSTRSSEGARYVEENGALTGTVRDYLQALLLLRPHDALHFTRHYFGSVLSSLDLPHDEYFDPSTKHVRYYFFED